LAEWRPFHEWRLHALNQEADRSARGIVSETMQSISPYDLVKLEPFSQDTIQAFLKERASQLALKKAEKDPKWKFVAGTGKLTINASVNVAGGQIEFGETNLYVIIGIASAPIAACVVVEKLDERLQCVKKELQQKYGRISTDGKPVKGMIVQSQESDY
jgi:hypothetical protein